MSGDESPFRDEDMKVINYEDLYGKPMSKEHQFRNLIDLQQLNNQGRQPTVQESLQ